MPHPSSATRYPENTPPSPHTPVEHQCNPPPPSLSIAPLSSSESRGTQLQVRKPEYIEGATYVCLVNNEKGKGIYRPCLVNKVMANGFITFTEKGPDDKYNDWTGPVHEGVQAEDFDIHPASYHTIHKGSRRRAGGLPRYGTSRFHVLNWICDDEYSHSVTKAKNYINLFTGEWFQLKGVPNTVGIVLGFTRTNDSKYHTFLYCVCGTQPPTQVQKWVYKQTYTQEFGLLCQTVASTYLNAKVSGKPAQWLTDDQAHAIQQVIDAFRAVIDDDTGEKSYTPPHRYFVNIKQLTTEEEEPPSLSAKRKRQISASINSPSIPSAPKSTIVSQPPTPAATSTMPTPPNPKPYKRGISLKGLTEEEKIERRRLQAIQRSRLQKAKLKYQKMFGTDSDAGPFHENDGSDNDDSDKDSPAPSPPSKNKKPTTRKSSVTEQEDDSPPPSPPSKKQKPTTPKASVTEQETGVVLKTTVRRRTCTQPTFVTLPSPISSPTSPQLPSSSAATLPPPNYQWMSPTDLMNQVEAVKRTISEVDMNVRTSTAGTTTSLNEVTLLVRSMSSTLNALQDQVNRMHSQLHFMSNTMSQSPHAYTPPQYSQYVPQMGYLPMHSSVPQSTVPPLSVPTSVPPSSTPQKIKEKTTRASDVDDDDHSSSSSSASTSAAPSTESEKYSSKHRHSNSHMGQKVEHKSRSERHRQRGKRKSCRSGKKTK